MAAQFAALDQQAQASLTLLRQNNEAIWLAVAHDWPGQNPP
jgi:hypothetical protein